MEHTRFNDLTRLRQGYGAAGASTLQRFNDYQGSGSKPSASKTKNPLEDPPFLFDRR